MQHPTLTINFSPGTVSGYFDWRREVLYSVKQAALPPLVLPIGDGIHEDEMVCDPVQRFSSYGDFNTPWLQSVWSYSERARPVSWKSRSRYPGWGKFMMAQTFISQFIRVYDNYLATDFRAPGWVHLTQKPWWRDLTLYAWSISMQI